MTTDVVDLSSYLQGTRRMAILLAVCQVKLALKVAALQHISRIGSIVQHKNCANSTAVELKELEIKVVSCDLSSPSFPRESRGFPFCV